jgi:predicted RNA-binding Zn ribbon-like protein
MSDRRRTLLDFLTSRDGGVDQLDTPERLRAWLAGHALEVPADIQVSDEDARQARRLRAALISLVTENSGGAAADPRTAPFLESITATAPLTLRAGKRGSLRVGPKTAGAAGALSVLLHLVYESQLLGEFDRFKACQGCGWAYYDTTKNRSRRWCDMASCGSREKTRAYRARQRAAGEPLA